MIRKYLLSPIAFLIALELLLFWKNYVPGTSLTGWDGLYPQLNFSLNLVRNVFGVWQEARGLGMWDGMSHASNLLHTLFLAEMSIVVPQDLLRYIFIFGMHLLGMIGMYLFLKKLFLSDYFHAKTQLRWFALLGAVFYGLNLATIQMFFTPLEVFAIHFAALPWLIFTLLSYLQSPTKKHLFFFALVSFLATPQGYVPQIFVSYVLLVLAILAVFIFYRRWNKPTIQQCLIVVVAIFCTNAFWLLPYIAGLPQNAQVILNSKINQMASNRIYLMNQYRGDLLDVLLLKGFMLDMTEIGNNGSLGYIMASWRSFTSSVWFLLPALLFVYITIFGIIQTIRTRKRMLYPFVTAGAASFFFLGNNIPLLNLLNAAIRFLLPIFGEAFRFPFTKFSTIFVFTYALFLTYGALHLAKVFQEMLATIQKADYSHFFGQRLVSQFPWLKKIIPETQTALYSQFSNDVTSHNTQYLQFARLQKFFISIYQLSTQKIFFFVRQTEKNINSPSALSPTQHLIPTTYYILLTTLLFLYALPAFGGHFFYDGVRVKVEPAYQKAISYFNSLSSTARIAILPQPTFYNWEYHFNDYRGSGFLWYGIPQSTMERSFDPWSKYNEQYYWELSQALYSHNALLLQRVLQKYQIQYVMLDGNRIYPYSPKSVMPSNTKDLLSAAGLHLDKTIGKIEIYSAPIQSTVFTSGELPSINSYNFTSIDTAYLQHGTYQTPSNFTLSPLPLTLFYPFRSLFTLRSPQEKDFSLEDSHKSLVFSATIPPNISHILLPSYIQSETMIPATFSLKRDSTGAYTIYSTVSTPTVTVGGQTLWGKSFSYALTSLPAHPALPLRISLNGQIFATISHLQDYTLGTTLLTLSEDNVITILDSKKGNSQAIVPTDDIKQQLGSGASITFTPINQPLLFSVTIPKVTDPSFSFSPSLSRAKVTNCNTLQKGTTSSQKAANGLSLSATLADACLSFDMNALTNEGYALFITHAHQSGEPLDFWAEDTTDGYAFSEVFLPSRDATSSDALILPPMQANNLGYSFHFDNSATGDDLTQNTLNRFSVYPVPFTFLQHVETDSEQPLSTPTITNVDFIHPNPSLYVIPNLANIPATFILSQAYDAGWKAYVVQMQNAKGKMQNFLDETFPFLFGRQLTDHVMVNNWENGWNLTSNQLPATSYQVIIVFLPQYLEYLGFILLVGYFLWLLFPKKLIIRHKK